MTIRFCIKAEELDGKTKYWIYFQDPHLPKKGFWFYGPTTYQNCNWQFKIMKLANYKAYWSLGKLHARILRCAPKFEMIDIPWST